MFGKVSHQLDREIRNEMRVWLKIKRARVLQVLVSVSICQLDMLGVFLSHGHASQLPVVIPGLLDS